MTKLILCLLCCFTIGASAQDTVKKSNSVGNFNEQFMVLKSNKKIRQGSYRLMYSNKLVASGNYDQGKKAGLWNFYADDNLVQQYDFTTGKLITSAPDKGVTYAVASAPGDSVKNPAKIGGSVAGIKFLLAYSNFDDIISNLTGRVSVKHTITLDENGKVASWVSVIKSDEGIKVNNQNFANIPDEALTFIPAYVNGKSVPSAIAFHDDLKGPGGGKPDASRTAIKTDAGNGKINGGRRTAIPQ